MAVYHTFITLLVPAIVSAAITVITTKFLMNYLYGAGVIEEDKNKGKPVKLPSSMGLAVVFGTLVGILTFVFGTSFFVINTYNANNVHLLINIRDLLAVCLSLLLISFVGFLDDINVKSKMVRATDIKSFKKGLKQWQKPLLTIIGALPLMAINAGISIVRIPLIGTVNLGFIYPLVVLPLAIIFVSNAVNLLGGFDALQPGMAIVATAGFLVYSLLLGGTHTGALISATLLASLLAFLPFNYKGKAIPGDSFTYMVGASFIAIMVMGNAESFGVIVFIPWIVEFFLHLRRKFKVSDLGIRQPDGTFKAPYGGKIYSLTHVIMNLKRAREKEIALYLSLIELAFVLLAFFMKAYGLL